MQIYGIDLSKQKFDVSFLATDEKSSQLREVHKTFKNTAAGILKFLAIVPADATLVAEHTGVYGEMLVKICTDLNVRLCMVGGYTLHNYTSAPNREKTDAKDCAGLREFGERFYDQLKPVTAPTEALAELRQLSNHRSLLVEQRKQLMAATKTFDLHPAQSIAVHHSIAQMMDTLSQQIDIIEKEIKVVMEGDPAVQKSYEIINSIQGVGIVTAVEIIIKTQNFTSITTARQFAAYAGVAPYEHSSGTMNKGSHISRIGNRRSKTLLYICAERARANNKEIQLYYTRRKDVEKKPHFQVINAIANKLLRIIFSLIAKGEMFDKEYICKDSRTKTA